MMGAPLRLVADEPERAPVLRRAAVRVRGVSKRFGRVAVLREVEFDARAGRVTAVLGPNGAGKSTLIKAILGLVTADAGSIEVGGRPATGAEYRSGVGYMPQAARFPENLTGAETIAMLRDLRGESDPDETLIDALGLRTELPKPVRHLSGGTRQKLNAAVAFMFRPAVLVLDEPTAGLDPVASGVLKDAIRRICREGAAVVITSHVLSELEELVDDVVFLLDGSVRFAGSLRELRERTGEHRLERAVARLMTPAGA